MQGNQLGALSPFVSEPNHEEQWNADIGYDNAVPIDLSAGEGGEILSQYDDKAKNKGKDGAEGKPFCLVGKIVQVSALGNIGPAEAVVANGNTEPGNKSAHA
ncbi:hypothetical protein D3C77_309810 [compost metagenome]